MNPSPPARPRTRFVADAMLGSLARKLRAFGFDTSYYKSGDDRGLLELAAAEKRVIVTADRQIGASAVARRVRILTVHGDDDRARIASLLEGARRLGIDASPGDALCSICSGRLDRVQRKDVFSLVPPLVAKRHRLFYRCSICGKVYWRGGHWKELRRLRRAFDDRTRLRRRSTSVTID